MTLDLIGQFKWMIMYILNICILYTFKCIQNYYHYILLSIKDIALYFLQLVTGMSLNFAPMGVYTTFTYLLGLSAVDFGSGI